MIVEPQIGRISDVETITEVDIRTTEGVEFVLFGGPSGSALEVQQDERDRVAYWLTDTEVIIIRPDGQPFEYLGVRRRLREDTGWLQSYGSYD